MSDNTPEPITPSLSRREAEAVMDLIAKTCGRVTTSVVPPSSSARTRP